MSPTFSEDLNLASYYLFDRIAEGLGSKVAVRYGAEKGWAFDTFLPERATQYTFRFFGSLMLLDLVLLALRWAGAIGS